MIITKTPFRMSFFGGGTDMESFFENTVEQFCQPHLTSISPPVYNELHAFHHLQI